MDKLEQLYNLYLSNGLITEETSFEKFSSANQEQQSQLYALGMEKNLFAETDEATFSTAWGSKKKDDFGLPQEVGGQVSSDDSDVSEIETFEANPDMANLYQKFKDSGIVNEAQLASIDDKIRLEKEEGDFGFFGNMKNMAAVRNPELFEMLGIQPFKFSNKDELVKERARLNQVDFLNELPNAQREELLSYFNERTTALDKQSVNAVAFNEVLLSQYKSNQKKLQQLKGGFDKAVEDGTVGGIDPRFFEDINRLVNETEQIATDINKNNSLIEESNEGLGDFEEELDLLRRNYGSWKNFRDKTRWAATDMSVGVAQVLSNLKATSLSPLSQTGQIYQGLAPESYYKSLISEAERVEKATELHKDMKLYIEGQKSELRPNMSVTSIDGIEDFGTWASEQIAQQLPVITVMAATGGTAGSAIVASGAGGNKGLEMRLENDAGLANYTEDEIALASFGYGAAEFVFEKLGTGAIVDQGKRTYKTILRDGLGRQFREGVKKHVRGNLTAIGLESSTEGVTQITQNAIDKFYLDKDVGLLDNVEEAMAAGGFMGHVMHASPVLAGLATKPFSDGSTRKRVQNNNKKIAQYKKALEDGNISETIEAEINKRISQLEGENSTIIKSEIQKIDAMDLADKKRLIEIDSEIDNNKDKFSEIGNNKALGEDAKGELMAKVKQEAEGLNKEKQEILGKYGKESGKQETNQEGTQDSSKPQNVEGEQGHETSNEVEGEIKPVPDRKAPDFVPDTDPKVKKERERSKAKLKALRDLKNKKAKDIQSFKKEAVAYVKSLLGTDDLNVIKKSEFNTVVQQIRDAKNVKDVNKLIDTLLDQGNRTRIRKSEKSIAKLLKSKIKDKSGKGLISEQGVQTLDALKQLLNDDITIEELDTLEAENEFNDAFIEAAAIVREMKYAKLDESNLQDSADFLESAIERLKLAVQEGRLQIKEQREADKERKRENVKEARVDSSRKSREQLEIIDKIKALSKAQDVIELSEGIREIKDALGLSEEFVDAVENGEVGVEDALAAIEEGKNNYFSTENFNKQMKSKNVFLDKVHQTYRYISSDLDTIVDMVSKKMSKNFLGGFLHTKISDGVRQAEEAYMKLTRKNKGEIHDKMKEIYEDSYSQFVKLTGDLVDSVVSDTSQVLPTGVFDKNGNEIKMSRGKAMWLHNQYKNPNLHDNFENAGLTPEVMQKITEDFLTEEDVQFANWLTDTFYPKMHSQLNPIFKKLYFRNLPKIQNYAGQIRYQGVDGIKSTDMLSDSGYTQKGSTLFFGSGIDRVNNARPISTEQDVFNNLFAYVDSSNRFTSSAEIYRDIKEILNDNEVTDNFKKYNRGNIKTQLEQLVDLSFGFKERKDSNQIVNFLIGAKILSSLALTPKILVTQMISSTLWLNENTGSVVKNALELMINPVKGVKLLKEIYNNSEYIRDRYNKSDFKKVEAAYVAENSKVGNKYRGVRLTRKVKDALFQRVALANVMMGDALGMFMLGVPYYQAAKAEGMKKFKNDEDKAVAYAIDKFNKRASKNQQSYKSNDRDLAQHTDLGKLVNMYGNSPKQYHRSTFQALLQLKRKFQGREHKGSPMANVWKLALNHMIQGALYQWVGGAMVGLLSEDDEDETKLKDIMWGATFGSFAKFFIIGDLVQALWDTGQGRRYGENPSLPIYSDYSKLFKLISNYKEAAEKDDDEKMDEVAEKMYKVMMDLAGVPASKTESLVDNYDKILQGDYDSDEEMVLRLLNYSQFAIDNMNEENKEKADKARTKKAAETRKRRQPKSKK